MRPDEGRPVPDLLLGGLARVGGASASRPTPRQAAAHWSRRPPRAVPRPPRPVRSRAWAAASGPASASSRRCARRAHGDPGLEQGASQNRSSARVGLLLADQPQQPVALLEGPPVGRQVARHRPGPLAGEPVERVAPQSGEPATSSISSGANSTVRSTPVSSDERRRATPFTRIRLRRPRGPGPAPPRPRRASVGRPGLGAITRLDRGNPVPSGRARRRRVVRWERPQASRTIASRRLVLPRRLGPQRAADRARTAPRAPHSHAGRGSTAERRIRRVGAPLAGAGCPSGCGSVRTSSVRASRRGRRRRRQRAGTRPATGGR